MSSDRPSEGGRSQLHRAAAHDVALEELAAALEQLVRTFEERLLEELAELEARQRRAQKALGAFPPRGKKRRRGVIRDEWIA